MNIDNVIYPWLYNTELEESELKCNDQYDRLLRNIRNIGIERYKSLYFLANKQIRNKSIQYLSGFGSNSYFPNPSDEQYISVDWVPKIITKEDFATIERGIIQRAKAFNTFLKAYYNGAEQVIPKEIIYSSKFLSKGNSQLKFFDDIYVHLYGIDLLTNHKGEFLVIEDNLGFPGGLGYAQEIRRISRNIMPEIFNGYNIEDIHSFSDEIYKSLASLSQETIHNPLIVFLQRGPGSVDRIEHRLLAENTHVVLADPEDLVFNNNGYIYLKLYDNSLAKVDVVYTRLSQRFKEINKKLCKSLEIGKVTVVTFQGNMLPGDKAIFSYIPDLIRYYLNEEPILKQPKSYWLGDHKYLEWALNNLGKMVIKSRSGLGGKQVLIGPEEDENIINEWKQSISMAPNDFIAQELIDFTKSIKWDSDKIMFSSVYSDLRMFAIIGKGSNVKVMKGGISRFPQSITRKVNTSLGGGIKDIWVEGE